MKESVGRESRAMRILWVKSGGLVPLDHGGKIRSFQIATVLAHNHDVTLFTFDQASNEDAHKKLKSTFSEVIFVPLIVPGQRSFREYLAYATNLLSLRPYSERKYCQPHIARKLREHLLHNSYDMILCDFMLTAGVIPWDQPGFRVLFTHNVEAQIWKRRFQVAKNPIWKAAGYREFRTTERMEHHFLRLADHVLAVSDADRDAFLPVIGGSKMSVVPTGVDSKYFRPMPELEQPNTLVFTGSMDWMPNEDGIVYFVGEILPLIRKEIPNVSLWIVGRRPSAQLRKLADESAGVTVTGRVEDIRPYMAKASVYVVPLLVGGGTRLKIFEAMAMGRAVVSTTIGAEGLPVQDGKDIVLADQPEEFARQAVALLRSSAAREQLGRSARQLVEQDYSWDAVGTRLSDDLGSLVRQFQAVSGSGIASSSLGHAVRVVNEE
jgi:sugar transferase (PEP-CTERM/EpsH1 system associated)